MFVSRLLFTFAAVVFIQETGGEECSFTEGDFSASWELDGNNVHFHVTKKNMDDNTWTAVAFGPSMP
uniref:DOMON domain-containing protein n=1 Tax=Acrobeloides nanus TaxID=290746 RepID=A0A914CU83_9BILA